MKSIFGDHMDLTGKVMDLRMERQNVVMSNIANIKTPGYRARRFEFEKALQDALDTGGPMTRTDQKHMPTAFDPDNFEGDMATKFKVHVVQGEDSVDIDKEMTIMAKNALQYKALETVLRKNFDGLRQMISDGGK